MKPTAYQKNLAISRQAEVQLKIRIEGYSV